MLSSHYHIERDVKHIQTVKKCLTTILSSTFNENFGHPRAEGF
jgi:hypothetical protein